MVNRIIPIDVNERNKISAERLNASMVVEAGAGTGKTTLLIDRMISLLDTIELGRIVAITFTDAAASELRERLRGELESRILQRGTRRSLKYLKALNELEMAHISTIHAFASSLVREHPVEAQVDPDFQHIDPDEENELLTDFLAAEFSRTDKDIVHLLNSFFALGGKVNHIVELTKVLHNFRDVINFIINVDEPVEISEWFNRLSQGIKDIYQRSKDNCKNDSDKFLEKISSLVHSKPSQLNGSESEFWKWIMELTGFKTSRLGAGKNWNGDTLAEMRETLADLQSGALSFLTTARTDTLGRLIAILKETIRHVAEYKQKKGLLGFDDQLMYARQLLKDNDILRNLRHRFSRLLIDEFQDTDPLQVEIALLLAGTTPPDIDFSNVQIEAGKLCVVGDPKQSIYRFRRADPRVYRHATGIVTRAGEKVVISQNFRSAPGIIDFVNAFFTPLWSDISRDESRYQPLAALKDRPEVTPAPQVAILKPGKTWVGEDKKADEIRIAEAHAIADQINIMVKDRTYKVLDFSVDAEPPTRKVQYGDIAVLFPVTTSIDLYVGAFTEAGIPFNLETRKGFYDRQIVTDLYNCICSIDNPSDRLALIGALRSPFFGVSDRELVELMHISGGKPDFREEYDKLTNAVRRALSTLNELHHERLAVEPDELIKKLIYATHAVPAFLTRLHGETDLAHIHKIVQLSTNYSARHDKGLRGFRRWLQNRMEEGGEKEGSPISGTSHNVRLLTMHGAKGLEFPVVFLANLNRNFGTSISTIPDRIGGRFDLRIGSKDCYFQTIGFDEALEEEEHILLSEQLRLLYVAMTRAKDHLIIPMFYGEKSLGYMGWLKKYVEEDSGNGGGSDKFLRTIEADTSKGGKAVSQVNNPDPAINVDVTWGEYDAWIKDRANRLQHAVNRLPQVLRPSRHSPSREYDPITIHGETEVSSSKKIGIALHSYMDSCEPDTTVDRSLLHRISVENCVDIDILLPLVKSCLNCKPWREAILSNRFWREVPVVVKIENGTLKGVIDLVWEDKPGNVQILDWKTGRFDPDRHRDQLRLYAHAIEIATNTSVSAAILFYAATDQVVPVNLKADVHL